MIWLQECDYLDNDFVFFFYIKLCSILTVLCVFLIFSLVEEHPCMKHYWRSWDGVLFHLIWIPVRFTSTQAKTWSYKNLLCDTHVSNFSSLDVIGISILHQVWSWASGLMSQMVSRRQPIYRLVCMVDVTSSASAVHQSPATQHRLTSASQHSVCYLSPHAHFLSSLIMLSVCCLRAADVQPLA